MANIKLKILEMSLHSLGQITRQFGAWGVSCYNYASIMYTVKNKIIYCIERTEL